jgi:hydroxyacylglutathione hydrolase
MELVKIKRIKFANVSGFLIYNSDVLVLVDTGHSRTTDKFIEAIGEIRKVPEDVDLIILTHTHFDRSGGAYTIKRLTGAPLAVHTSEADFLRRGRTPYPRGTRWKGKLLVAMGRIFERHLTSYPPVEPDILVEDELDLSAYGIPGKVAHTPGHTSGSLSVLLDSGEAIVCDNVLGLSLTDHYPPFANDRAGVIKSWELYISSGMKTLLPAHGGRVQVNALSSEIASAKKRYIKN